jgi:DNA (cytosine-5)-methyltransferase 1
MKIDLVARQAKLARLREGGRPRVLELCSGCGGLSLGLASAGFELVAHLESDPQAAVTYALNFAPPVSAEAAWRQARDMTTSDLATVAEEIGLEGKLIDHFDLLAAGLPCQAFARIGRSKLRSVKGDENAFKNDPRAKLYQRFLHFVEATQPAAILIENVPDIMNFGGHNVPEEICGTLEGLGYVARYTLLNAAFYGVPQLRERLFLIAIDKSAGVIPSFPKPTHYVNLPSGYGGVRSVALKHIPESGSRFMPIQEAQESLIPAVTTQEALDDLPRISEHLAEPVQMRRRKMSEVLPYANECADSGYLAKIRNWPGLVPMPNGTDGHVVRITPRDFETFRRMRHGGNYPHAHMVAESIFKERLAKIRPRPKYGTYEYAVLRKSFVPPYDPGKFPNKWGKLDPAAQARTLTAHLGKDTYSHIHWDSDQRRSISVREAARLQSFPDNFRFAGAMNTAFRQIGNAVPPFLAEAVATNLRNDLARACPQLEDEGTSSRALVAA